MLVAADQCGQNPAIDLRTYSQNLMHCLPVVCVTSVCVTSVCVTSVCVTSVCVTSVCVTSVCVTSAASSGSWLCLFTSIIHSSQCGAIALTCLHFVPPVHMREQFL